MPVAKNSPALGGFHLKWYLKRAGGPNEGEQMDQSRYNTSHVWKPAEKLSSHRNLVMTNLMNMVADSKKIGIKMEKLWGAFLQQRWTDEIIKRSPCLSDLQMIEVITKTRSDLKIGFVIQPCCFDEDSTMFAFELFAILKNCPSHLLETWRLSKFLEHLLDNYNLRTVIASTLHTTIQSDKSKSIELSMWYKRLDERYNISLGKTIVGLSGNDQLAQLSALDLPYLEDYKQSISQCLEGGLCDLVSSREGNVHKHPDPSLDSFLFRGINISSQPPSSCDREKTDCLHPVLCF